MKNVPRPSPKRDEALVEVKCIGICGSDVHYYEHGKIGSYEVKQPIILGHELAGVVVQVGEDVCNIKVGDRVAVEPGAASPAFRSKRSEALDKLLPWSGTLPLTCRVFKS